MIEIDPSVETPRSTSPSFRPSPGASWKIAASLLLVGGSYFVAGKVGLFLAVGNASVSAIWPATGLAIAALLLGGSALWPAVFAGAFMVNLTTTGDPISSLGIASGNSLEALVGTYLAARYAGGTRVLDRPQSVLAFAVLSGFLASTIAASVGMVSLVLTGHAIPNNLAGVWGTWWLGDAVGAIEVTPLILSISHGLDRPARFVTTPTVLEGLAVGTVTVLLALVVFAGLLGGNATGYPLVFVVIPPTIWAAMRFGSLGATATATTVSVVAILATVTGSGPFALLPADWSLLALRAFVGSLVLTALLVASEVTQRNRLELELYRVRKTLQRMLQERTRQLEAAKSLAQVGTWTYDVESRKIVWSDEMYRALGYGEARFPVVLGHALDRIVPQDRETLVHELRAGIDARGHAFPPHRIRLLLPGGERKTLLSQLHIAQTRDGRPTKISGTIQDISELQRVEDELRKLRPPSDPSPPEHGKFLMWMIPWVKDREDGTS